MLKKDQCQHEWKKHGDARLNYEAGPIPSYVICEKCKRVMTLSEAAQLELTSHELGFQKKLATAAFIISIIALVASSLIAWYK